MKIDGYTRLAAVVANPIKHSISPFIHNRAFEATHTNGVYLAWEVEGTDLAETVANIRRYQMFGINLSMPYKEQVAQPRQFWHRQSWMESVKFLSLYARLRWEKQNLT